MTRRPGGGGAATDGGVEYQRAVASYAIAYGIAGQPLRGFGAPANEALVESVSLETDNDIDDIKIEFQSGFASLIQARRTLRWDKRFKEVVDQWVGQVLSNFRPERDRLVVVCGELSGSLVALKRVLDRLKTEIPATLTQGEKSVLDNFDLMLSALTPAQRIAVHKCALIHVLRVEELQDVNAREVQLLLSTLNPSKSSAESWHALNRVAGRTTRLRGGYSVEGWLAELRHEGVSFDSEGDTRAALFVRRNEAVQAYFDYLRDRASHIDLRGLGALFPRIPIEDVDAEVRVVLDQKDTDADLVWAFLRRGRMILTGLPGSGKSTALLRVAAKLSGLSDGPFPIFASLAEIDRLDHSRTFGERLVEVALNGLSEQSRRLVSEEVKRRLVTGELSILLDSLDETYEHRTAVVVEVENFLKTVSVGVSVLLSTRDVAYAQAETLEWPSLRLRSPANVQATTAAIINAGARRQFPGVALDDVNVRKWVELRKRWVGEALRADPTLSETPLLPTLLSLLAIEMEIDLLPTGRANVLRTIVTNVVGRRNSAPGTQLTLGRLVGEEASRAAMTAFEIEGSLLVAARGEIPFRDLVSAISKQFGTDWNLPPEPAELAAVAAVHFWDESGIFVIHEYQQLVRPRLLLFAEIGDALAAMRLTKSEVREWVTSSLSRRSIEPLILAAGISPVAADEFATFAASSGEGELLLAVARGIREGATLEPARVRSITNALATDAENGDHEGWQSWLSLVHLPRSASDDDVLERSIRSFPSEHVVLGNALIDFRDKSREQLIEEPSRLISLFQVHRLPRLARRRESDEPRFNSLVVDQTLAESVVLAADFLLGSVDEATSLVVEGLNEYSIYVHDDLVRLLSERGFESELVEERKRQVELLASMSKMFVDHDLDDYLKLLTFLADHDSGEIPIGELVRLDELADFLETLRCNDASARRAPDPTMCQLIYLVVALGAFDISILSSEASVVLRRVHDSGEGHVPFFALFDGATRRELNNWSAVGDKNSAVELCLKIFTWGLGSAWVAADALYGAPIGEDGISRLRALLRRVASSYRHVFAVALTICSLVDGPEPDSWVDDDDPFIRLTAAHFVEVSDEEDLLSASMRSLLGDLDGTVRESALRQIEDAIPASAESALQSIEKDGDIGWTCLSCKHFNTAESAKCETDGCLTAKPHPAARASKLLALLHSSVEDRDISKQRESTESVIHDADRPVTPK